MEAVATGLQSLPRIFTDLVLPKLPQLQARFEAGARVLDVGCGAGFALVHLAERFPRVTCVGVDEWDTARRVYTTSSPTEIRSSSTDTSSCGRSPCRTASSTATPRARVTSPLLPTPSWPRAGAAVPAGSTARAAPSS